MLATCSSNSLRDIGDRAILMVAFASGGRRRSGIAGLRLEQMTGKPPVVVEKGPPLPSLAIHLGRTKKSGADYDGGVYLTGRSVDAEYLVGSGQIHVGPTFRRPIAGVVSAAPQAHLPNDPRLVHLGTIVDTPHAERRQDIIIKRYHVLKVASTKHDVTKH
jgi:hypothetical protein